MKCTLMMVRKEWKLFIQSKLTWAGIVLINLFLIYSLLDYTSINDTQFYDLQKTSLTLLLNSANHGAIVGIIVFGMLTIFLFNKDQRKNAEALIQSSVDPLYMMYIRITTLLITGILTVLMNLGIAYSIHRFYYQIPFDFYSYLYTYTLVILGGIVLSVFMGGGFYLMTGSLEISFLSFGVLFFVGFSSSNYLYQWIKPQVILFSDFAGIEPMMRLVLYNRLFSAMIAIGILLSGILIKRYCFSRQIKKGILIASMIFIGIALLMYHQEPYVNEKDSIFRDDLQRIEGIELREVQSDIEIFPEDKSLMGTIQYEFTQKQAVSYIDFIFNNGMVIDHILLNGVESSVIRLEQSDQVRLPVLEADSIFLEIKYHGRIKYPIPSSLPGYITDQSLYLQEGSYWMPTPLVEQQDIFHLENSITVPSNLTVVSVGRLEEVVQKENKKVWHFTHDAYGFDIGVFAAQYIKQVFDVAGTKVEFYYSPIHEGYVQTMRLDEQVKDIVSYYQRIIGPYPFPDVPLEIAETSIYKTGGHSTANVVTVAESGFNRSTDGSAYNYYFDIQLLAHEIAHQWWGTGVKTSDSSPWSSEGLANYYSYKYMVKAYGDQIANSMFRKPWKEAVEKNNRDFYTRNPGYMEKLNERLRREFRMGKQKIELYYYMPLLLIQLEEEIGEVTFLKNMSELYEEYLFTTISYEDVLKKMDIKEEGLILE